VDDVEDVKRLREEYEGALDEAETKRAAYHRAIKKMHLAGVPLREIAEQLGLSHQRVHQIVTGEAAQPPKRKRARSAGVVAALILLVAGSVGVAFAWTHRGPFTPIATGPIASNLVSMPRVTGLSVVDAQRLLSQNGVCVAAITASGSGTASSSIDGQSPAPGSLLVRGANGSLEVPGPERAFTIGSIKIPIIRSEETALTIDRPTGSCGHEVSVFGATVRLGGTLTVTELGPDSGKIVFVAGTMLYPDGIAAGTRGPDLTHFAT
jgi:hypothetical protein